MIISIPCLRSREFSGKHARLNAGEPTATSRELRFNDAVEVSSYALNVLCWATENGIIGGRSNGILDPRGQATRAQVTQMLMNYLKK